MKPLVADASAALAYVLGEPAGKRTEEVVAERCDVLVPWLFWSEVVNSLARCHRWPGSQVLAAVYDLEQLGIHTEAPARTYLLGVIDAVERHALTAYDAEYLVLAESADADLLTGDAHLAVAAGDRAVFVGAGHRLAEVAAGYATERPTDKLHWSRWPGAARYLDQLRRESLADV